MLQNYFMEISSMYRKGQNLAGVGQIRQKSIPHRSLIQSLKDRPVISSGQLQL